jgi:hypothetical protein
MESDKMLKILKQATLLGRRNFQNRFLEILWPDKRAKANQK